jgi:hypothetical protein
MIGKQYPPLLGPQRLRHIEGCMRHRGSSPFFEMVGVALGPSCIEKMHTSSFFELFNKVLTKNIHQIPKATTQHLHTRQRVKIMLTWPYSLENNGNSHQLETGNNAYPEIPTKRNSSSGLVDSVESTRQLATEVLPLRAWRSQCLWCCICKDMPRQIEGTTTGLLGGGLYHALWGHKAHRWEVILMYMLKEVPTPNQKNLLASHNV